MIKVIRGIKEEKDIFVAINAISTIHPVRPERKGNFLRGSYRERRKN